MKSPLDAILDYWQPTASPAPAEAGPDPALAVRVLPLYVASLIATLAGIGAVAVTLTGQEVWTARCMGLAALGHVVSFYLRRQRVPAHVGYIPAVALIGVALVHFSATGTADLGISAEVLTPDLALAVLISWLTAIRCFALVSNGALVFSSVPALATIGLSASVNPNSEIPTLFGLLLFVTIFMAIYEQHVGRSPAEIESRAALPWHMATAGIIFATVLAAGSVVGVVVGRVVSPLAPYALPAISQIQATAPTFVNASQGTNTRVRVGGGPITLPPTPVFDVFMPGPGLLRTGVLEDYDGRTWNPVRSALPVITASESVAPTPVPETIQPVNLSRPLFVFHLERSPQQLNPVPAQRVKQVLVARTLVPPRVPVLDRPVEVRLPSPRAFYEPRDGVAGGPLFLNPGAVCEVTSDVPSYPADALRAAPRGIDHKSEFTGYCLKMPATVGRVPELAQQVTAGKTNDYDRVQAIIEYINRTCKYSLLEEPTPEGEDAVEFYLFTSRVGACDLAASAAIMMCRAADIPARAVTGYVADNPLPAGGYGVRQMDAHMWLEVFFPGYGWVPFNPSPPARDAEPTRTQWLMNQFRQMFASLSRGGIDTYLLFVVVLLALAVFGPAAYTAAGRQWARWNWERAVLRAGGPDAVAIIYRRMTRRLARAGWMRDPAMTPAEYAAWLSQAWGASEPATGCVARITDRLVRACYAEEHEPSAASVAMADLERMNRSVPRAASLKAGALHFPGRRGASRPTV